MLSAWTPNPNRKRRDTDKGSGRGATYYGDELSMLYGVLTTDARRAYVRLFWRRLVKTPFGILITTGAMYLQCGICGRWHGSPYWRCTCDFEAPQIQTYKTTAKESG